jgi:hypothetical protein
LCTLTPQTCSNDGSNNPDYQRTTPPLSFRATGITNFLENDGTLEAAQRFSGRIRQSLVWTLSDHWGRPELSLQAPFPEGSPAPMARQSATGSCVRQILQKEVWLWAGNKWVYYRKE